MACDLILAWTRESAYGVGETRTWRSARVDDMRHSAAYRPPWADITAPRMQRLQIDSHSVHREPARLRQFGRPRPLPTVGAERLLAGMSVRTLRGLGTQGGENVR
jgi:hypothetical protein